MYTVTFYSYRGGVGRTTALVNVAVDLALRKRNVLLVDFDLEAPSLTSFALLRPDRPHPGLVEFIDEYRRSGRAPEIADYVYQARPIGENRGEVWVMPAGRGNDDYWRALLEIDWQELFVLQDGFVLFESIKSQLCESFHPDYVLVDARAGINNRLDLCTRWLPDAVVMLFPSDQSTGSRKDQASDWTLPALDQAGLHRVLTDIDAESQASESRRIDFLPVACQVPDPDGEELYWSVEDPDYSIFDAVAVIPHAPELLRERQVIVSQGQRKLLPRAYRRLANALIKSNCTHDPDGARAFLKELQLHPDRAVGVPAADLEDPWRDFAALFDLVIENFKGDAEILAQAASCLFLAGDWLHALETLDAAIALAPPPDSILWQRASYRRRSNEPSWAEDLLQLLDAPAPSQLRRLDHPRFVPYFPRLLRNLVSAELDTKPLVTADPLTNDWPGVNPYVASAFRQICEHFPERKGEALQKRRIQQLSPEAREALIAGRPAMPLSAEEDLPFLIQSAEEDLPFLIQRRKWKAAIALLEPRVAQAVRPHLVDVSYLALAYWGSGNESRATELCRLAMDLLGGSQPISESQRDLLLFQALGANEDSEKAHDFFFMSLISWRAGDKSSAKRFLERCDQLLTGVVESDFFSFWRFQYVTRYRFQRDWYCLLRMVQGCGGPPHFLGKKPGSA